MLELDTVQTLALGGLALFLGYGLCRAVPVLGRYNLPPPVVGGLVFALLATLAHARGTTLYTLKNWINLGHRHLCPGSWTLIFPLPSDPSFQSLQLPPQRSNLK